MLRDHLETIADDLRDPEFVNEYLQLGWADGLPTFLVALRNVAIATLGMTRLAEITGMSRESLYKTLSPEGNPRLETVRKVLQALGYDLQPQNNFSIARRPEESEATTASVR